VAEYTPFQLPEELKKRGAVYSHADTIDAPWAVRSGGEQPCVACACLTANRSNVYVATTFDSILASSSLHPVDHTLLAFRVC
jgi:hypothetical protein